MEQSKYEIKAKELFLQNIANSDISCECNNEHGDWIDDSYSKVEKVVVKVMCQLAKEVEDEYKEKLKSVWELYKKEQDFSTESKNFMIENTLYTKEQVEELLAKQRELCTEKAETIIDCIGNYTHVIDKDSILNAKLDIE